ncbi:hypothetical protein JB92DRAFT_2826740 [Gautieria morchelliformis]|nr:hypothetical protein JB92DRAFT_2826740 [Gautieria morchelliformis]
MNGTSSTNQRAKARAMETAQRGRLAGKGKGEGGADNLKRDKGREAGMRTVREIQRTCRESRKKTLEERNGDGSPESLIEKTQHAGTSCRCSQIHPMLAAPSSRRQGGNDYLDIERKMEVEEKVAVGGWLGKMVGGKGMEKVAVGVGGTIGQRFRGGPGKMGGGKGIRGPNVRHRPQPPTKAKGAKSRREVWMRSGSQAGTGTGTGTPRSPFLSAQLSPSLHIPQGAILQLAHSGLTPSINR